MTNNTAVNIEIKWKLIDINESLCMETQWILLDIYEHAIYVMLVKILLKLL